MFVHDRKKLPSVFPFPYVRLFCILPASFLYYLSGVIWGLHYAILTGLGQGMGGSGKYRK